MPLALTAARRGGSRDYDSVCGSAPLDGLRLSVALGFATGAAGRRSQLANAPAGYLARRMRRVDVAVRPRPSFARTVTDAVAPRPVRSQRLNDFSAFGDSFSSRRTSFPACTFTVRVGDAGSARDPSETLTFAVSRH